MRRTPELCIQFTKRGDGAVVLRCTRRDGSVTWQRHDKHAAFFSFHDLTHFAVETSLSLRQGFYGLLADGWDIVDTTGKGGRGKLPPEAVVVEHLVGLFDRERAGGAPPLKAADFNAQVQQYAGSNIAAIRVFTDAELLAARSRIDALHKEWVATATGSTLELSFNRADAVGGESAAK
jgi:hypothetical protein